MLLFMLLLTGAAIAGLLFYVRYEGERRNMEGAQAAADTAVSESESAAGSAAEVGSAEQDAEKTDEESPSQTEPASSSQGDGASNTGDGAANAGDGAANTGDGASDAEESASKAEDAASKAEEESSDAEKWKQDTFETESSDVSAEEVIEDIEIPEEIRAFVAKYPEAAEFAANYAQYAGQHLPIDISTDVAEGELPMFLQWDPRWGYETYGNGFMGIRGCGPTCLSMVYSGLSGHTEWNPYRMAQYAEEGGYYVENVGTEWGFMQTGAQDLGMTVTSIGASEKGIGDALRGGEPVICAMGPGDFTYSGHFIVLCGIDDEGNITIHDPNSRVNSSRTWTAAELVPQIKALWSYRIEEPEVQEEASEP